MTAAESWHEELPCIWVLAGVLSYRLCDRAYDCENCELYYALRGNLDDRPGSLPVECASLTGAAAAREDVINSYICRLTAGCDLHLDRQYCPCHFWLYAPEPDQVLVGLDAHVLRVLNPVTDIVLPPPGVWLKRSEPCGWLRRGRISIPLHAPLSGEVEEVNEDLTESLRAEGRLGDGDDWVMRLKPHENLDDVSGLYRGEEVLAWYTKKIQLLKRYLRDALSTSADSVVGMTLNDGGTIALDMEHVLGRGSFEALVDELFERQI